MTTHGTGESYDVIIIGAGPAGIFSGLELARGRNGRIRVAIIEKGPDIDARICSTEGGSSACRRCDPCSVVSGWGGGGAGAFSDGKLTLQLR